MITVALSADDRSRDRRRPGKLVTMSPETMQAVDAQRALAIREDQNPE